MSSQPCGCDPEWENPITHKKGHLCARHTAEERIHQSNQFAAASLGSGGSNLSLGPGDAEIEVRVRDPKTGGEKGSKLARFSLIPAEFLWALAEHYGRGAKKYDDRNWERGYKWSLSIDALSRHLHQWLMGEDNDPETGTNHLIAVAWHACALFIFQRRKIGEDDVRSRS